MPDLTTYTDHPRTIPTLDALNARREAARLAREDQKRARLAHFRQLEQAAQESFRRPAKTVKMREEPKPRPSRAKAPEQRQSRVLYVCKGTCGRMTRPKGSKPHPDCPDAIPRRTGGKCSPCLTGGRKQPVVGGPIRPCLACDAPTRTKRTNPKLAPDNATVRDRRGRCETCAAADATPRSRVRLTVPVEALAAEYRAGASTLVLGNKYGVSETTVSRRLVAAGVTMRPPGNIRGRKA